ncbi:MAG: dephospho-CoA kinase [Nitrospirae bacterium]|nr:dephospho-CoA kinase [Nitrospirota bacterium]
MVISALTGNFGMGKSCVLSIFRELGAVTLDSDRIVSLLLKEENVIKKVKDLFGDEVVGPDNALDRKAIAARIFQDKGSREAMEALIHPLVFAKVNDFVNNMKDKEKVVIVEVPLLFEGEYQGRFQKTITVYTSEDTALKRLEDSGISREDARARLRTQLPIDIKKKRADYTIDNSATREETRRQVERIYNLLKEESATPQPS